jgi:hypothetical protein
MITISAEIVDEAGNSDAAYDLNLSRVTPERFCTELLKVLRSDWGLTHQQGAATLNISIVKQEKVK